MKLVMNSGDEYDLLLVNYGAYTQIGGEPDTNFFFYERNIGIAIVLKMKNGVNMTCLPSIEYQYNSIMINKQYYLPVKIKNRE